MEGPLRGLLAGAAAWKFGGGCISTILIFILNLLLTKIFVSQAPQ